MLRKPKPAALLLPAEHRPTAYYSSRSVAIALGASTVFDTATQVVCILSMTGGSFFTIRLNDGETGLAAAGWQYRAPTPDGVRKVELINDAAASPIEVFIAFAVGELVWNG